MATYGHSDLAQQSGSASRPADMGCQWPAAEVVGTGSFHMYYTSVDNCFSSVRAGNLLTPSACNMDNVRSWVVLSEVWRSAVGHARQCRVQTTYVSG